MKKIIVLLKLFFGNKKTVVAEDRQLNFTYKYQRHPFDDCQYFTVQAANQEEANAFAIEKFTEFFNSGKTIMNVFYPVLSRKKSGN